MTKKLYSTLQPLERKNCKFNNYIFNELTKGKYILSENLFIFASLYDKYDIYQVTIDKGVAIREPYTNTLITDTLSEDAKKLSKEEIEEWYDDNFNIFYKLSNNIGTLKSMCLIHNSKYISEMINHRNFKVRAYIASIKCNDEKYMDILVHDKNPCVRLMVAIKGHEKYRKILLNDSDENVKRMCKLMLK